MERSRSRSTSRVRRPATPGVSPGNALPSRALVPLQRNHPDKPCVCLICEGEATQEVMNLMAAHQAQAARLGYDFSAIVVKDDALDTRFLVIDNAPCGAIVRRLAGHPTPEVNINRALGDYLVGSDVHPPVSSRTGIGDLSIAPLPVDDASAQPESLLNVLSARSTRHEQARTNDYSLWSTDRHIGYIGYIGVSHCGASSQMRARLSSYLHGRSPIPEHAPQATHAALATPTSPLAVLGDWLKLPESVIHSAVWKRIEQSSQASENNDARDLALFFASLKKQDPQGNGEIGELVRKVVEAMAQDEPFTDEILRLAHNAARGCDDRVALHLYLLETAWMARDAKKPTQDLSSLLQLARQLFCRERIFRIAAAKVDEITAQMHKDGIKESFGEAVETYLAYVHKLFKDDHSNPTTTFDLGGRKPEAKFIDRALSHVSGDDITQAGKALQGAMQNEFDQFLATWEPWQIALSQHPQYQAAVHDLRDELASLEFAVQIENEAAVAMALAQTPPELLQEATNRYVRDAGTALTAARWQALTRRVLLELDGMD
jgi:hypothetical protein